MSTRYVYSVYNTTVASRQQTTEVSLTVTSDYTAAYAVLCNSYESKVAYNRQGTPIAQYVGTGSTSSWGSVNYNVSGQNHDYPQDTSKYKYVIVELKAGGTDLISVCYLLEYSAAISGAYWHESPNRPTLTIWNNNSSTALNKDDLKPFYKSGGTISKGSSLISTQSASSKSLSEGAFSSGDQWRWREYRGSDNIDPTSVSYSKSELYAGDVMQISVSARTPTYGGTVYYQYQYTFNGTTWTNLGSKTTSTSASVTIPEGAKQFRARVVASDGWGFTSTTYVYGPSLGVSQLKAYSTVAGVTRTLQKGYCIVDGTVRSLVKGYVTVGGVWKKLF